MFVDSHCHLDRLDLRPYQGDLGAALQAAQDCGVSRILCVGIDLGNAQQVIDIAERYQGVYASVGVHPNDIEGAVDIDSLRIFAAGEQVIAIGETGLDYYYSREQAAHQQRSFEQHLALAGELQKPVIVHTREAREDTIALLRSAADLELGGVMHCFTESWEMAREALDLNFYISFSGIVTFRNAEDLREVARKVPMDRLLIETDAPYLAPVPHRGKKNEPKYVADVGRFVAELKGVSVEELARSTAENFDRLFRLTEA